MFTDEEHKFKADEYMFKDFECIFTAHKQKPLAEVIRIRFG